MEQQADYEKLLLDTYKSMENTYVLIKEGWYGYVLFTPMWWLLIFLTFAPWIIWYFFKPKRSAARLLFGVFFVTLISIILDSIGILTGAWYYRYKFAPFTPEFIPWDITIIPVSLLFTLQIKPKANPLIKGVIWGGSAAFIGEPLLEFIGFYEPVYWRSGYSFWVYILLFLIAYFFSTKINSFEKLN
ncbi:CBO0543 family protein [Bacillus spongiae]|uniref:CBO0543 family protein n=1 Tax=Bacillus spongiae TaxID=2683610 RepID=A0ABU8HEX6_9BACI